MYVTAKLDTPKLLLFGAHSFTIGVAVFVGKKLKVQKFGDEKNLDVFVRVLSRGHCAAYPVDARSAKGWSYVHVHADIHQ